MKKRLFFVVLAAGMLLWGGCHRSKDVSVQRSVVTKIIVTCDDGQEQISRHYTSPEKMRPVLLYIRSVRSPFTIQPSEDALQGRSIHITTISADETTKVYTQRSDKYFQEGSGGWEKIDPEKAADLWDVLLSMPSDPE